MLGKSLSVVGNIQKNLSKILNFKGVAHEKSGEILKKIDKLNFHGMTNGRFNWTFAGWTMCKILRVFGNIQIFVEIYKF